MKIEFVESVENRYLEYYAISKLEVYKGKLYDELFWAEITPGMRIILTSIPPKESFKPMNVSTVRLIWEDDYYHPLYFDTLEEAKKFVSSNWQKHQPYINGNTYEVE